MEARRGMSVKASRGREREKERERERERVVEVEGGPRKDAAVPVSVTSCDVNNCT